MEDMRLSPRAERAYQRGVWREAALIRDQAKRRAKRSLDPVVVPRMEEESAAPPARHVNKRMNPSPRQLWWWRVVCVRVYAWLAELIDWLTEETQLQHRVVLRMPRERHDGSDGVQRLARAMGMGWQRWCLEPKHLQDFDGYFYPISPAMQRAMGELEGGRETWVIISLREEQCPRVLSIEAVRHECPSLIDVEYWALCLRNEKPAPARWQPTEEQVKKGDSLHLPDLPAWVRLRGILGYILALPLARLARRFFRVPRVSRRWRLQLAPGLHNAYLHRHGVDRFRQLQPWFGDGMSTGWPREPTPNPEEEARSPNGLEFIVEVEKDRQDRTLEQLWADIPSTRGVIVDLWCEGIYLRYGHYADDWISI